MINMWRDIPFRLACVVTLILACTWGLIAMGVGLNALVKSNQMKGRVKRIVPPPTIIVINDNDIFHSGIAATMVLALITLLCAVFILFHLRAPLSSMPLRAQAFLLAFCAAWLFAALVSYTHYYETRSAIISAFIGGTPLPEIAIQAVQRSLGLTSRYRDFWFLRLFAILPWFTFLLTLAASVVLFMAASRASNNDDLTTGTTAAPKTNPQPMRDPQGTSVEACSVDDQSSVAPEVPEKDWRKVSALRPKLGEAQVVAASQADNNVDFVMGTTAAPKTNRQLMRDPQGTPAEAGNVDDQSSVAPEVPEKDWRKTLQPTLGEAQLTAASQSDSNVDLAMGTTTTPQTGPQPTRISQSASVEVDNQHSVGTIIQENSEERSDEGEFQLEGAEADDTDAAPEIVIEVPQWYSMPEDLGMRMLAEGIHFSDATYESAIVEMYKASAIGPPTPPAETVISGYNPQLDVPQLPTMQSYLRDFEVLYNVDGDQNSVAPEVLEKDEETLQPGLGEAQPVIDLAMDTTTMPQIVPQPTRVPQDASVEVDDQHSVGTIVQGDSEEGSDEVEFRLEGAEADDTDTAPGVAVVAPQEYSMPEDLGMRMQAEGIHLSDATYESAIIEKQKASAMKPPTPPAGTVVSGYNPKLDEPRPSTMQSYLRDFEVLFIIDDSGSMNGDRWLEAYDALVEIADYALHYHVDSVDLRFINSTHRERGLQGSETLSSLFKNIRPFGGTRTGRALQKVFDEHLARLDRAVSRPEEYKKIPPLDIIVLTDGMPTDDPPTVIENAVKRLKASRYHPNTMGVQFVQIGDEYEARTRLKELIRGDNGSIVDTVPYRGVMTPEKLERIVLGGIHPNVPPHTQLGTIPQGWRPPYQGPPPIPAGMNVNPQLWQAGKWQLNPTYFSQLQGRPPQSNQHTWAAGQAWQNQRSQESASKNPYKRVPKPPSAEYLATQLSDNPLGLSDMIPAVQYYAQQQANDAANSSTDDDRRNTAIADSPWIWNPPQLAPADDPPLEQSTTTSSSANDRGRPHTPARPSPTTEPGPPAATRPSEQNLEQPKVEDPFTSKRQLVPTFSINIVRTPEHYKLSPSRSSSRSSQSNRGPRSSADTQQLAVRMENLSTADFSRSLSRQFSTPDSIKIANSYEPTQSSPSTSGVSHLVEEPATANLLSPLLITTPKSSNRALGRHPTFPLVNNPSSLDTIPEASLASRPNKSSRRTPSRCQTDPVDAYHYNYSPNHPHSNNTSPHLVPSPSRSSRSSSSSRASSQQPSPTTSLSLSPHDYHTSPPTFNSSGQSNPLPVPPAELSNVSLAGSKSNPLPVRPKSRVRKGYWNKRGDHLTMSGYIVYAPHGQAYPPELQDYPDQSVGYRDNKGQFVNFLQRPELPESLPHHGQPPLHPYHTFLEYV
ncbi:hypothetical protein AX17_005993 [Amanita inopinata Kibby_2008]|nr:hypothetical protein AX17_005993 [Amanita inopinata Kibby_2008]